MATHQTPGRRVLDNASFSQSSDRSWQSPERQESNKRKMQTTVAIREPTPHAFKIQPLKHIPTEQRPTGSPSLNFDRPFAGPRLELPTLYHLLPDREASTYAFSRPGDGSPGVRDSRFYHQFLCSRSKARPTGLSAPSKEAGPQKGLTQDDGELFQWLRGQHLCSGSEGTR